MCRISYYVTNHVPKERIGLIGEYWFHIVFNIIMM